MPEQAPPPPQQALLPTDRPHPPAADAQPNYGAPPPGYSPPQPKSNKGLVIGLASALGVLVLVGVVLLVVWLSSGSRTLTASAGSSQTGGVTREALIGVWARGCPNDQTGNMEFKADSSTTSSTGEPGAWALTGSTLTIQPYEGHQLTMQVSTVDSNSLTINIPGPSGSAQTLHRCNGPLVPFRPSTPPSTTATTIQPAGLSHDYLVGRWGEACPGSSTQTVTFSDDGGFAFWDGLNGRWALVGNSLTLTKGTGGSTGATLTYVNTDTLLMAAPNSRTASTLHRCR